MQAERQALEMLNDYLTMEMTAVNTYFGHARMCSNWGYERLAGKFREISFSEMRDAEAAIDRLLFFEGVPNLQRLNPVTLGETVPEQLEVGVRIERDALEWLNQAVATCVDTGDQGSREFFAAHIPDEEEHLDWLEAQVDLVEQLGEAHYLSQQIRE